MLIDSHHHLWVYNATDYCWMTGASMDILRRDYLMPEFQETMRDSNIDGAVVVQARQIVRETEWLLGLAAEHSSIRGVIGWVPLTDPHVCRELERLAQNKKLKAVRHVLHDARDDLYMLGADFGRGIRHLLEFDLVYDLLIFERHLPQTIRFVDQHPNQKFVLDHIAKPRIREQLLSPWQENIRELAKRRNVFCKVSGMITETAWDHWTVEDLRPYFDVVVSAFGPERLMFGSDWPVVTLAGGCKKWSMAFTSMIAELSAVEQERICRGTAIEAYRL